MINEIKAQARRDIENVVADYRNDEKRQNYRWRVKPQYTPSINSFAICFIVGVVFFTVIRGGAWGLVDFPLLVSWYGFIPLGFLLVYSILTVKNKRFQEKVWYNDAVSDEDILRLCKNTDLKPLIKEEIEHGYLLTYTSLLEKVPEYLSLIEALHAKKEKQALIRKIDQNC
ncbi:TPA: hypothetical protein I3798_004774 [Enterobacter cloacae]|nr:hypothetical protein [Enterobacter cloacae]HAS1121319.1 hypothetical protein [Enterobacter cloacae]